MFKLFLKNDKGEAYVGESVKIVVAIVLGAALLAGCVLVFNHVILPNVEYAMEWGFGNANEKVEQISDSQKYTSLSSLMRKEVQDAFKDMTDEEKQEICDEINADYPDCVPAGGLTPQNITSGDTYLCVAYAADNGVTYQEAYNLTKTTEGQKKLLEWADF